MFQFPAFASYPYVFRIRYLSTLGNQCCSRSRAVRISKICWHCAGAANHGRRPSGLYGRKPYRQSSNKTDFPSVLGGFPHSEIVGSKGIRTSPTLIAAYHVLHRLCMPRHPPVALKTLDHSHCQYPSVVPNQKPRTVGKPCREDQADVLAERPAS